MLMKPLELCISPRRADMREDFPEPTAPTTATNRPGLMSNDTLENTVYMCFILSNTVETIAKSSTYNEYYKNELLCVTFSERAQHLYPKQRNLHLC